MWRCHTLDLVELETLTDMSRLDSSEPALKEVAPLHESGVVGLALWLRFGFLALLLSTVVDFDLRWRTLHSSGKAAAFAGGDGGPRCNRTRRSTTITSSVMAALTHSSSVPPMDDEF